MSDHNKEILKKLIELEDKYGSDKSTYPPEILKEWYSLADQIYEEE